MKDEVLMAIVEFLRTEGFKVRYESGFVTIDLIARRLDLIMWHHPSLMISIHPNPDALLGKLCTIDMNDPDSFDHILTVLKKHKEQIDGMG